MCNPTTGEPCLAADRLAALVGSRLCHDLVSPLSAIGNGVELLTMAGEFPGIEKSPEFRLIQEAVATAQDRIKAFRVAFGHAAPEQRIGHAEAVKLARMVLAHGRVTVEVDAQGDFPRSEMRLLMLSIMCLETAMPWGGRVLAVHTAPGWRVVAESPRMKHDPALWSLLRGEAGAEPAASEVHFALLAEYARAANRRLECEIDTNGAEIRF